MKLCLTVVFILITVTASKETEIPINIPVRNNAQFLIAYQNVLKWEGGYCANDNGAEGYAGINRKYVPKWLGWYKIDQIKKQRRILNNEHLKELDLLVLDFYLTVWVREGYMNIEDQRIANYLFDFRNHGQVSIRISRLVLNNCGFDLPVNHSVDTSYIDALNQVEPTLFLNLLKQQRIRYYERVSPLSQGKYLNTWIQRSKAI